MNGCRQLHDDPPALSYNAWHEDADQRAKSGEEQIYCPHCRKWIWNSFYHHLPGEQILKHLGGRNYQLLGHKPPTANPQYRDSEAQRPKPECTCLNCLSRSRP